MTASTPLKSFLEAAESAYDLNAEDILKVQLMPINRYVTSAGVIRYTEDGSRYTVQLLWDGCLPVFDEDLPELMASIDHLEEVAIFDEALFYYTVGDSYQRKFNTFTRSYY